MRGNGTCFRHALGTLLLCAPLVRASSVPPPVVTASAAEIAGDPNRFVGRRVRVEGAAIHRVLSPPILLATVRDRTAELAVAVPFPGVPTAPAEETPVVASGRVWLVDPALFLVWPALMPARSAFASLEGRPVVVAESLRTSSGADLALPPPVVRQIEHFYTRDAGAIVDREIDLAAVTVAQVSTPRAFDVRSSNEAVVHVQVAGTSPGSLRTGDVVDVKGVVRMSDTAIYPWSFLPAQRRVSSYQLLYVVASDVRLAEPAR